MQRDDTEQLANLTEMVSQLLRRQEQLESRVALLEGRRPDRDVPVPAADAAAPRLTAQTIENQTREEIVATPPATKTVDAKPLFQSSEATQHATGPALETKLGLTLLNRVGAVTLVLGIAFFFKWAVDNNWIGPAGRVLLGVIAGLCGLAIADRLWHRSQQVFAQGVTGASIAVLYVSIYAGFAFYHLVPQALAFLLMVCITGLAIACSLRYAAIAIAALGLAGGFLTPILLSTGQDHPWFLFSYLFLLDATALGLSRKAPGLSQKSSAHPLQLLAAAATIVIYLAWLLSHTGAVSAKAIATLAPFSYFALFSIATFPVLGIAFQALVCLALIEIWPSSFSMFFVLEWIAASAGLTLSKLREWRGAPTLTLILFWAAAGFNFPPPGHTAACLLGTSAGFLLFLAYPLFVLGENSEAGTIQWLSMMVADGAAYYAYNYALLRTDHHAWLGPLAIAVAAVYLFIGAHLHRHVPSSATQQRRILLSLGVALAFVTLAIPIQFTGFRITTAWSLQAAALTWIAARMQSDKTVRAAAIVFALVIVRLLFLDSWQLTNPRDYGVLWNGRFLTFAAAAIALFLAARWATQIDRVVALSEYIAGHFVLLFGLSLETIAWVERGT
ncbi:MAG: DUF2339 domain-containing protein, partial [Acidobacteriaceae bacterium]|nr:DUF2339 domain-containing protein [Acidobacteriaceae bacterium]